MKFTFLIISALSCGAAANTEAAATNTHPVHDAVKATFKVNSDIHPHQNAANDEYIGECLASTFNTVHANTAYHFDSVDLKSETIGPGAKLGATELGWPWDYGYQFVLNGRCRFCSPDDWNSRAATLMHTFGHWESDFCACLQGSSDPVLQSATYCQIDLKEIEGTRNKNANNIIFLDTHPVRDEVKTTFEVNSDLQPTENANNDEFIGHCIASSFNTVHANTAFQFDSVELESETIGPGTGLASTELGWPWDYGYQFVLNGRCRFCSPDDWSHRADMLMHTFDHWESQFCACLQGSSDLVLQSATNCKIDLKELEDANNNKKNANAIVFQDTHPVRDEVKTTFEVNSDLQPTEDVNNDDFIGQCIASSFNTVHANNAFQFDSVELESETITPGASLTATELGWPWDYGYQFVLNGRCRFCSPDDWSHRADTLTQTFDHWESQFCACLQGSSDPILQSATGCKIEFKELSAATDVITLDAQQALRGSVQKSA